MVGKRLLCFSFPRCILYNMKFQPVTSVLSSSEFPCSLNLGIHCSLTNNEAWKVLSCLSCQGTPTFVKGGGAFALGPLVLHKGSPAIHFFTFGVSSHSPLIPLCFPCRWRSKFQRRSSSLSGRSNIGSIPLIVWKAFFLLVGAPICYLCKEAMEDLDHIL